MRVVLADDSVLLREGLSRLCAELGHEVVAAVGSAPELLVAVAETMPDIAVIDVRMPPDFTDDGLRAAVALRSENPNLAILVLSQYVEESYARDLLSDGRGRVGYLLKDRIQDIDQFSDALNRVSAGETVIDPEVVAQLLVRRPATSPIATLSEREQEVLALIAQGKTNAAIAMSLYLSAGAVEKHISNIFSKLGLLPSPDDHRRVLAVLAWLQQSH
ncbi:MAG: response regulator transcription factor [Propionibacteriaceae bacterium]|nr:response regulator transcription factor [Propionibacteriaceae bacterium]